jgi:hypothetical protein
VTIQTLNRNFWRDCVVLPAVARLRFIADTCYTTRDNLPNFFKG